MLKKPYCDGFVPLVDNLKKYLEENDLEITGSLFNGQSLYWILIGEKNGHLTEIDYLEDLPVLVQLNFSQRYDQIRIAPPYSKNKEHEKSDLVGIVRNWCEGNCTLEKEGGTKMSYFFPEGASSLETR